MARGRFVSKQICVDKDVNKLSSPWSMLGFTWLLTHADCEGRTYGDPAIVKAMIFPRQDGVISTDDVEGFIREWNLLGLITWYEVEGDQFIEFPNFEKHQPGIRKDREAVSLIPKNPLRKHKKQIQKPSGENPEELRSNSGENQLKELRVKSKGKGLSKDEVEAEELDNDGSSSLLSEFESLSKLEAPRDPTEWNLSLQAMANKGITKSIMRQAIAELTDKNYKIVGPKSIEQACVVVLAKRERERSSRVSSDEFSQFIIH